MPMVSRVNVRFTPRKRTLGPSREMSALCQKQTFTKKNRSNPSLRLGGDPEHCSDRPFAMPDENIVHHVEHAHPKLLRHWCEPWRGLKIGSRVGEPLLPSRLHGRATELEIL